MEYPRSQRRIRSTEVDREIEGRGKAVANRSGCRPIIITVRAQIRGGQCNQVEGMDFFVWAVGRLRIGGDRLDNVCSLEIVCASGPYGVVGSIESDSIEGRAAPL
jgi:hypothetical protein